MKKIFLSITIICVSVFSLYAQTNTFPTSGNVGIGTTSPMEALELIGNIRSGSTANNYLQLGGGTGGTGGYFQGTKEAGKNAGYGAWVNYNSFWDGTNWIQPRGSLGSYSFSSNNHLGFIWRYATSNGTDGGIIVPTELMRLNLNGYLGIGTGSTISAKLHIINTTRQLRLGYDIANYSDFTVDATGNLTIAATGTNPNITITPNGTGSTLLNGNVGVGTTNTFGYKLAVNGSVIATSMTVKLNANWPDYVFKPTYKLQPLTELKAYINQNHRLPDMPSAKDMASDGVNLGEINKLLTQKIEELTLYAIKQHEQINTLISERKRRQDQSLRINKLEKQLQLLIDKTGKKTD